MIFLLILCGAAVAVEHTALTMEQAVERALQNSPEARALRASVEVAAAQVSVARGLPAPQFRWSASNVDADPQTVDDRMTVGLRFTLPRPRELSLKQQIARTREQSAAEEVRAAEARLAATVRLAYRRSAIAVERFHLARRTLELRHRMKGTLLRQVAAGLKQADETDLMELTVSEAESELRRAQALSAAEKQKLARLIEPGGPVEFALNPEPAALEVPSEVLTKAELMERATRLRAELAVMSGTCLQLKLAGDLARNERYPWISFFQVTRRTTPIADRGAWGFQLGIDLPFFRSTAAAEARVAAAQHNRCELQRQALQVRIQHEVDETLSAIEEARRELAELDRLRTGPGERALDRARLALAAGRADQLEVMNAEARVISLRDRWLDRRLHYASVEAQLENALGEQPGNGLGAHLLE